jgi:cob(I)alamin adenosyltransferase
MCDWTPDEIRVLLDRDVLAVERGLVAIYKRQTEDEKESYETKHHNRVGFAACHAQLGTYYANWILSGKHLSGSHVERARKMVRHYARQLYQIALAQQGQTQTTETKEYANVA